jgi:hypothetical protein
MSLIKSVRSLRKVLIALTALGALSVFGGAQVIHQTFPVSWIAGQTGSGSFAAWNYQPYTTFSSALGQLQKVEIWITLTATGLIPGDHLRIVNNFFTGWSPSSYQDAREQTMSCPNETATFTQSIVIVDPTALQIWVDPLYGPDGHQYMATETFQGGHQISGMVELFFYYSPAAIEISCDIKPGTASNSINLKSNGVIPVAILTTSADRGEGIDFDALSVDPGTVTFGPGQAVEIHGKAHAEDVDADGDLDLVFHFATGSAGLSVEDTVAEIRGKTITGIAFTGHDKVICKK